MRQAYITMTSNRPIETETAVTAALQLTEGLFLRAASAMETLAVQAEAGEIPDLADMKKTATALREQEAYLLKERERVLAQCKTGSGAGADYAIDFDAVRAEIGGRLDRLRQSQRTEEVLG